MVLHRLSPQGGLHSLVLHRWRCRRCLCWCFGCRDCAYQWSLALCCWVSGSSQAKAVPDTLSVLTTAASEDVAHLVGGVVIALSPVVVGFHRVKTQALVVPDRRRRRRLVVASYL